MPPSPRPISPSSLYFLRLCLHWTYIPNFHLMHVHTHHSHCLELKQRSWFLHFYKISLALLSLEISLARLYSHMQAVDAGTGEIRFTGKDFIKSMWYAEQENCVFQSCLAPLTTILNKRDKLDLLASFDSREESTICCCNTTVHSWKTPVFKNIEHSITTQ